MLIADGACNHANDDNKLSEDFHLKWNRLRVRMSIQTAGVCLHPNGENRLSKLAT